MSTPKKKPSFWAYLFSLNGVMLLICGGLFLGSLKMVLDGEEIVFGVAYSGAWGWLGMLLTVWGIYAFFKGWYDKVK